MKPINSLIAIFALCSITAFSQNSGIVLTFTAIDYIRHVQLDSIKIMNRTQGSDTVLFWPDTVLALNFVGIPELSENETSFRVSQNYPNPAIDHTSVSMYIPESDNITIIVSDVLGRKILDFERGVDRGWHLFRFVPGNENIYFFTAVWRNIRSSIRILHFKTGNEMPSSIIYEGAVSRNMPIKAFGDYDEFLYSPGDQLLFIGNANGLQSGFPDDPGNDQTYTFQFTNNMRCPGTLSVDYEGQVYNTTQVFSQCWLKENLNVGWMIPGIGSMSDNGLIEKFCYNDEPDSCAKYGGLYEWSEMMQYVSQEGVQGICPPGWHLPTDEEWKVLEGSVDSQYGIGNPEWDRAWDYRGLDAGTNAKSSQGWYGGESGTDLFRISLLPGGAHLNWGVFDKVGSYGHYWTSTPDVPGYSVYRYLDCFNEGIYRRNSNLDYGISVRCVRDIIYGRPIWLNFTAEQNRSYVQLDSIRIMNRTQGVESLLIWPDTVLMLPYGLTFRAGDALLMIGYRDTLESSIIGFPEESETYTFRFATDR